MPNLIGASLMNNGQACVAQTRILASRDRYQDVVDALCDAVSQQQVGDPLDPATTIGPLVAERQRDRVEGYIAKGQEEGAKVVRRRRPPGRARRPGWYVEPTVFVNVDNQMTIAREEIFGPVLAVIPYDGVDDAVRIANDSDYGLSGSVWSRDTAAGVEVAKRGPHRYLHRQRVHARVLLPVRRVQAVGRRARARARGPGRVPRGEVDQPARGLRAVIRRAQAHVVRTMRTSHGA